ncbi:MAG: Lpg1974 family pore-forming outer membrane protein [Acidobacteriota bacterium]
MRLRFPALAAAALVVLLGAPGVPAAQDPDWEGWFIDLDTALLTPGNTNTPVQSTTRPPFASRPVDTTVQWTDWDSDAAFRFGFGYSFGREGTLKVSYWNYDDSTSAGGSAPDYTVGGYNWWTVGPVTNLDGSYYYAQQWQFNHDIEAETIDLEFTRSRAVSKPVLVTYGVGLRYASFEETVDGRYLVDPGGIDARFPASRHIDSDGFGLTGSLGVDYDFTEFLGIRTNLRVGFLTADIDAEQELTDLDSYSGGGTIREEAHFNDEVATTIDFDVNLAFHTGPYLDVDVGWMFTTWSDLVQHNLSRSTQGLFGEPTITGEDRDRINWSGARLRLIVHL